MTPYYADEFVTLYHGDCVEIIPQVIDDSAVDLIATDLPYGMTDCSWDTTLPLDELWRLFRHRSCRNAQAAGWLASSRAS